ECALLSPRPDGRARSFVEGVLGQLRSGKWWLSYDQRKVHDAELLSLLGSANQDLRLAELGLIERAIRGFSFRDEAPVRQVIGTPLGAVLLMIGAPAAESRSRAGVALAGRDLTEFLASVLAPIRKTVSYRLSLVDTTGAVC